MYWRDCSDSHLIFTDILPIGGLYVPSSLYEAPNNETDENMNLYPHLRFTAQAYVTGWRVRGESVGGQGVRLYPHLRFTAQAYVTGWRVKGESVGGQGGESEVSLWEDRV